MQYRINSKNGDRLSTLGYGCMRFTRTGGVIDQKKAESEMRRAIELGVNYFDTAYTYPGSEVCVGRFLSAGYRDRIKLATKMPQYMVRSSADLDRFFSEELKRLNTDHIDYYLLHMLADTGAWSRLQGLEIEKWIEARKSDGSIRNIGFSYHGGTSGFKALIDAYDFDFCQIQFNYFDKDGQAGEQGLKYAAQKGLPVIIMEPLRGGRLAGGLPEQAKAAWAENEPGRSFAELGFRWLWNYPEVTVVLSGMNSVSQIEENCRTASEMVPDSLTRKELEVYDNVRDIIKRNMAVPCTGCGYCMPCPAGVDIPTCFNAMNVRRADGWMTGLREYIMCTSMKTRPTKASMCIKCGRCEQHCPQKIEIRRELSAVASAMEGVPYKVSMAALKLLKRV